ncbi:MAG: phosphate ABC transporter permease PstA [Burkholderiales bacterium]|nr:phosphate ABC transporter permease PstA [Burkholderiales bacterium]
MSNNAIYFRRRMVNVINLGISSLAMLFGLFWLAWILFTLLKNGFSAIHLSVFTQMTPPPGSEGGLANAIVGSVLIVLFSTLIGTPIGIMAGIYLAEYGDHGKLAAPTRFINDILLATPSILIGMFIWTTYVNQVKHFSGWAGSFALALIVIPVVVRTTENMLRLVPNSMREAAYALGTPRWKVVSAVTLRASKAGVLTGVMLAVSRIAGETAPVLFTALNNQFFSANMNAPMASLPAVIYQFANNPDKIWNELAWASALIMTFAVLVLNIVARVLVKREQHH